MRDYRITDLRENQDGDLVIVGGDIAVTDDRTVENVAQYARTILSTHFDYQPDESIGFDPSAFGGVLNTADNAMAIAYSIKHALTKDGYITPDSVTVEPIPTGETEVLFLITIHSVNMDGEIITVKISAAFDTLNGKILTLRG